MGDLNSVWSELKATYPASLDDLVGSGYTRTLAGSGLARVSPFQVELGNAADPATESSAPFELDDWTGYDHNGFPTGTGLIVTGGYGTIDVSWTAMPGYSRAPSILRHLLYVQPTGETSYNLDVIGTDPKAGGSPFFNLGDGVSAAGIGVSMYEGTYIAVGVVVEFDDSDALIESPLWEPDGSMSEPLSVVTPGVAIKVYDSVPTINSVTQSPGSGSCFIGDDVDVRVNVTMEGPSTGRLEERVNGGEWTLLGGSIGAGTNGNLTFVRAEGNSYQYRLRYNDVSPDQWATSSVLNAECTLR